MNKKLENFKNFCKDNSSYEFAMMCSDNFTLLQNGIYDRFEGCPANFGEELKDYIGLCELEEKQDDTNDIKYERCIRCWKKALELEESD